MYCNHMHSQIPPSTPLKNPQHVPLPNSCRVLSFFLVVNDPLNPISFCLLECRLVLLTLSFMSDYSYSEVVCTMAVSCPGDRISQSSPHSLALIFFLLSLPWDSLSLGDRGNWYRCPIEDWALSRHSFSAVWVSLCLNCWPLQRNVGERQRVVLIYVHKHKYVGNHLVACPFSKTTVVGSMPALWETVTREEVFMSVPPWFLSGLLPFYIEFSQRVLPTRSNGQPRTIASLCCAGHCWSLHHQTPREKPHTWHSFWPISSGGS